MTKVKLSVVEKRTIRSLLVHVLVQVLIVLVFIRLISISLPINIDETEQVTVTVDDAYRTKLPGGGRRVSENWLVVVADSNKYWFENVLFDKYPVKELHQSISKGDELTLTYYKASNIILGNRNIVVAAESESETYRTIKAYNQSRQGVPVFVAVLFLITELVFLGELALYIWLKKNILKEIRKKIKKSKREQPSGVEAK